MKKNKGKFEKIFVVTEGVFSMEGDIPDLQRLVKICRKYKTFIIIDDCHGVGILGKTG